MPNTVSRPHEMFVPSQVYTIREVAELLKTTPKAVRHRFDNGEFPPGGVVTGFRDRRVWGWAVNQWLVEHSE